MFGMLIANLHNTKYTGDYTWNLHINIDCLHSLDTLYIYSLFAPEPLLFKQIPPIAHILRNKGESITALEWKSFV